MIGKSEKASRSQGHDLNESVRTRVCDVIVNKSQASTWRHWKGEGKGHHINSSCVTYLVCVCDFLGSCVHLLPLSTASYLIQ
ncbi:hypothetical protein Pcinc_006637 [Petrolisthes cinctipes]|uniref:Uncharacterized protein n=1 Tax=Petrolisthes cinctipes TaxID=88211 RepID=A0AAE1GCM4_PETCI|nr:hypothetical protein Pcinc_006637 [Petrolisthes cinctipes]